MPKWFPAAISVLLTYLLAFNSSLKAASNISIVKDLMLARQGVFKIMSVSQEPDPASPWLRKSIASASGTGFYIGNKMILTNAHVVEHARYVSVKRSGDLRTVTATIKFVADDADLALLTVEDSDYFDKAIPLKFGQLPVIHSPVSVVGYPIGGDKLSITEGVVSRIDSRVYIHSDYYSHLLIQVDSAINSGNSGGPVVQNGKVVGVAFQALTSAQSTGYVIPSIVVQRFLSDVADGHYDGHPELGLGIQEGMLINRGAANFYRLPDGASGVLVAKVESFGSACGFLRVGDVLMKIDGQTIDFDGRVVFSGERVPLSNSFDLKQIGESVSFEVLREGKKVAIEVPVHLRKASYYPGKSYAERIPYTIYGGLVFSVLSPEYLSSWGSNWVQKAPLLLRSLHKLYNSEAFTKERDEIVVLTGRLPHAANEYARSRRGSVARSVNGHRIKSLSHFESILSEAEGDTVTIDFADDVEPIVLDRKTAISASVEIKDLYKIVDDQWPPKEKNMQALTSPETEL